VYEILFRAGREVPAGMFVCRYSNICDIQYFRDQRVASYSNFIETGAL
jgi:hypothetical protein